MEVTIMIRNGNNSCYTTHDLIQGHVIIKARDDCALDEISISLEGQVKVRVERHVAVWDKDGYTFGEHTFLRMSQPTPVDVLPKDRLANRGATYLIPFGFTVPETLLSYACNHGATRDGVAREAHLLLPPSIGGCKTEDGVPIDDLAPERVRVTYRIRTHLRSSVDKGRPVSLKKTQQIRIIPMMPRAPRCSATVSDNADVFHPPKTMFKTMPSGRLQAAVAQEHCIELRSLSDEKEDRIISQVGLNLRFDPDAEGMLPPKLHSVRGKLCAFTFFGATPYEVIPNSEGCRERCKEHASHKKDLRLAERHPGKLTWVKHSPKLRQAIAAPMNDVRGAELIPTDSLSASSTFYTTTLQVPICLAQTNARPSSPKFFTPTFSSCLISRSYILELQLSFSNLLMDSIRDPISLAAFRRVSEQIRPRCCLECRIPVRVSAERPFELEEKPYAARGLLLDTMDCRDGIVLDRAEADVKLGGVHAVMSDRHRGDAAVIEVSNSQVLGASQFERISCGPDQACPPAYTATIR